MTNSFDNKIKIEGFSDYLTDHQIYSLVGNIIHVPVGGLIPSEGISWFELFRFARVLSVELRSPGQTQCCSNCKTQPIRFKLEVEWETGYEFAQGNILCEHCIDGVVREGQDSIAFGNV
jgi:hypothetical protein